MKQKDEITYWVTGFLPQRGGDRHGPPKIVEERVNGYTVNIYTGYDIKGERIALYPKRFVTASRVPFTKKIINLEDTRRDF